MKPALYYLLKDLQVPPLLLLLHPVARSSDAFILITLGSTY